MSSDLAEKARLVEAALLRFQAALESRSGKLHVSSVSRGFARGRGRGLAAGIEAHRRLYGDVGWITEHERVAIPFPLAWRFRFGWLLGVADLVVFERGTPRAVVEVKSYGTVGAGERVQASLYGLLAMLNFLARPRVYLQAAGRLEEVQGWEELALEALRRASRSRTPAT
uniref:PD-(D/E)XK endonuclease-like domain-containing protein n=1 Tax=Thermofilum pendens TaxID=2269 RepID=A0A7J3X885_THEPE